MLNYLNKLKEKCNINDELFQIINDMFDKLLNFSYISKYQARELQKRLYKNIDVLLIGNEVSIDYKSGYYDAVKKELYLKDIKNLESVYLRILYAMTTTEVSKDTYNVGYSTSSLSLSDYKIRHENFGLNRAVASNLVCRLLYTLPTTLSIMPTYRTYENDFLGNKISSDNDIYFLEGTLLAQICYILDINEEDLYNHFFTSPMKYYKKFITKISNNFGYDICKLLDSISKNYSLYNKLNYFNKCLNDNYINIKRKFLKTDISSLEKEKDKIKLAIADTLSKVSNKFNDNDEIQTNIENSLAEEINNLEELILNDISSLQNTLVDYLINDKTRYSAISYAVKLKELEKILILENRTLKKAIYETISIDLMNTFENTASNKIEKIKYSIINEILSSDKYIKIYKNMSFQKLTGLIDSDKEIVAVTVDDTFIQLIEIKDLCYSMKNLENNTISINLNNMSYLLNTPSVAKDINIYERLFTKIHTKFPKFNTVRIENMYLINESNLSLVLILQNNSFSVLQIVDNKDNTSDLKVVKLSEPYTLFNLRNSSLPMIYNKKESILRRFFSFLFLA